ncbi:MAG TPA: hypothetical protein VMD30_06235 [Tepidisphaeraceae bacterium]|nr:hypothetical protein [Tepidisphaeraceae bacterium]
MLDRHSFNVGRFCSLERLVEQSKNEYYKVLALCSDRWSEGHNQIVPWWNYFLTILRRGYSDFAQQVDRISSHGAKTDQSRQTALAQVGPFTLADLHGQVPAASPQLLKKVLAQLKKEGLARVEGHGRGARWVILG